MANTYTQMHVHFVFAVESRVSLIAPTWRDELYRYITGIVQKYDHKLLAIGGMDDHIHILVGLRPTQSVSELMLNVKSASALWVNKKKLSAGRFEWQKGYAAFSYSRSHVPAVIDYILHQKEHHVRQSMRDEHILLLRKFEVEYNEDYVFHDVL